MTRFPFSLPALSLCLLAAFSASCGEKSQEPKSRSGSRENEPAAALPVQPRAKTEKERRDSAIARIQRNSETRKKQSENFQNSVDSVVNSSNACFDKMRKKYGKGYEKLLSDRKILKDVCGIVRD